MDPSVQFIETIAAIIGTIVGAAAGELMTSAVALTALGTSGVILVSVAAGAIVGNVTVSVTLELVEYALGETFDYS
jgi:hypothetical protein